ncbi:MAG: non-heme iron oxygenase ferredoxin subunit [Chloroflexi bacterium]|nr:non-heme iron oxygenase ferredoxin subunit [Chloroflexota bacterium]MCH8349885.1 non-heme iron oxygenase ferredoxin subunit [Chloroflexota bacterium]MCI0786207.1 non-heme iron oxygenase ferredoxin subunit [Chloroflexota bacterium]MCI0794020.1 non-heme iron oxygenase ferredoxin subunit [Chloroflexota bacterium]MCI0797817.1 non-heme iron oxygenase ferredoxin subunit [Chloroflexota bacterium]
MADTGFVRVADISEIPPGEMKAVKVGIQEVLLVNVDGVIHACDNWCNHQRYRLSAGDVDGEEVRCDLHGSKFNVVTGEATNPPATEPMKIFEVRLDGSDVLIRP